jgi:hypothetical protein
MNKKLDVSTLENWLWEAASRCEFKFFHFNKKAPILQTGSLAIATKFSRLVLESFPKFDYQIVLNFLN